jgi:multidrug efflux pump subunit AcrB
MSADSAIRKSAIGWMAGNSVAANLLMLFLLAGGLFEITQIKQEVFPEYSLDQINISVAYPGASPEEVVDGIVLPVEEAVRDVEGVKKITSNANEGSGLIQVEAVTGTNIQQLATDIKNEVDRITSFPEEAEEPLVVIPAHRRQVVTLIIYGAQTDQIIRNRAEFVRDQLLQDKDITYIDLEGDRPLEMQIEIPMAALRAYNLTLADVAAKIRAASLDLPGGGIKAAGGEILLRVKERRDYARQFAKVPIVTTQSGAIITLADIATVKDDFEDTEEYLTYNGLPAIGLDVYRVGEQTPIQVSDAVRRHISRLRQTLPAGLKVAAVHDRSDNYRQRISLLLSNGFTGLALVFILLGLFLEARLAFWVTMGIPTSFLGAFLILPLFGTSINMVSLFAFIIAIGIVVDDAIVVGENVYSYRQQGEDFLSAAIKGAREIATPVTFSILTNIATFLPLYFVPGVMGKIFRYIPVVVISAFSISLIEALFVLPAHLSHQSRKSRSRIMQFIYHRQQAFSHGFTALVKNVYGPSVKLAIRYRYVTVTLGAILLLVTMAYVKSGRIGVILFPKIESDYAYASASLPYGAPVAHSRRVEQQLIDAALKVKNANGGDALVEGIFAKVNGNTLWIKAYLTPPDKRPISTADFVKKWRRTAGSIAGLESLRFMSDRGGPGSGPALTVELQHRDSDALEAASSDLAEDLAAYPAVSDIDDGFSPGKEQFDFKIKPAGYRLGLSPSTVARQVRNAYYGSESIRQLRGRNEIKIMVRLPETERHKAYYLENMTIHTPLGRDVPLTEVAAIKKGRAYTSINRRDGRQVLTATANVTPVSRASQIIDDLKANILPKLQQKYPGLNYSFEGKQADMRESMQALFRGLMIAVVMVYILLAIPFRSYIQPAIIMISIPFGIVGAIIGHLIMGYNLSILSMFGIVALSGVAVNDSLVLIDFANRQVWGGATPYSSIVNAGIVRFRPIMLTTLTTFFGLTPMILETSRQARFLIPMAISLGFGILFSTLVVLVIVPALYMILEDAKRGILAISSG